MMKKILLAFALYLPIASTFAFESCRPGDVKYLGKVNFTVTAVSHSGQLLATIRDQFFPILDAPQELALGDQVSGALFCRCVDIGHIPGRQTYWSKFVVQQDVQMAEDSDLI